MEQKAHSYCFYVMFTLVFTYGQSQTKSRPAGQLPEVAICMELSDITEAITNMVLVNPGFHT